MACFVGSMKTTESPAINGVVETALYVEDLVRAMDFYVGTMGLNRIAGDGVRFEALDSGSARVLLLFKRRGTLDPVSTPGGFIPPHDGEGPLHIGFAIPADAYDAWKQCLERHGVRIESEVRWERGGRSLYFRDPDGHLLELITPGIWKVY
jgi:catechol 2,3-dioxygenase-like lactoylglutathione lyase family enzyme